MEGELSLTLWQDANAVVPGQPTVGDGGDGDAFLICIKISSMILDVRRISLYESGKGVLLSTE